MGTSQQPDGSVGTAVATRDGFADLTKASNVTKFASMWDSKAVDKLNLEQRAVFLATLGNHIGVRAELGELILYQGKPYITIDGRIRLAHETGLLNGIDIAPASSMDRERYGCETGDMLWICRVYKKGATRPFVGWGFVGSGDRNPVAKTHPRELAKKRAKYDALRLAFPPLEHITELHTQYIAEAEQEAAKAPKPSVIASASYGDDDPTSLGHMDMQMSDPDDDTVLGDDTAADVSSDRASDDELALGDTRSNVQHDALRHG